MNAMMMGSLLFLFFGAVGFSNTDQSVVSVTRFEQQVEHLLDSCHSWTYSQQDQLQTELEHQLSQKGIRVVERKTIRAIYDNEYELPNMNKKTQAKRGQFVAAKFTITGGISELGICEESSSSGVQLGGIISLLGGPSSDLALKKSGSVSKVKLVANVISVETGVVINTFEAKSEISDSSYGVRGGMMGIGAAHEAKTKPPIERATNQAIQDLAGQIAEFVSHQG